MPILHMRRYEAAIRCVAVIAGACASLLAQAPAKRALVLSNTAYQKLPPPPVDHSGPSALADELRDAQFKVILRQDLAMDPLAQVLNDFQSSVQAGEICLLYYSGYLLQDDAGRNYLAPVDFDPASKEDITTITYPALTLERGLASRNPSLSMLLFDAAWDARIPAGRGVAQPSLPPRTWMFAAASANQVTRGTSDKAGWFTKALTKVLSQPGLDLTDVVTAVTKDVGVASKGEQQPQAWSTDVPKFYFHEPLPIGVAKQNKADRLMYVYIPPGKFWMGCAPASEDQCKPEEKPRHPVEITKGFWLGQTEVTNDAYMRFDPKFKPKKSGTNPGKQGNLPVVAISWEEAQKYCQWAGGRLPTEAEWERASRGGKDDEVYPFADFATSRDKANFAGKAGNDRFEFLAPVQQFDPNAYNLYDMAGNAWEWVEDWYSPTYYQEVSKPAPARDPHGPEQGQKHVARGGGWFSDPKIHLRISYRKAFDRSNEVGFRCLLPDK